MVFDLAHLGRLGMVDMGSATTPGPRRPRASAAPDLLASVASLLHVWGPLGAATWGELGEMECCGLAAGAVEAGTGSLFSGREPRPRCHRRRKLG